MRADDRIQQLTLQIAKEHGDAVAFGYLFGVLQKMASHQLTPQQYVERYMREGE